jgi:hypothetical protein
MLWRNFLHKFKIHWYMNSSAQLCGNVSQLNNLENWQKYSYRKCWLCPKEKPHSRYFFNIGIKEKNAVAQ